MAVNHHITGVYPFALVLLFLLASAGESFAQLTPFDQSYTEEAALIDEEILCYTDRTLYVTEELIHFSAFVRTKGLEEGQAWSSVLYVELLSAQGSSLFRGKYRIIGGRASGAFLIPDHIKSGNYYLRSYTRWMRNLGPEFYHYVPVKIVNPDRPEMEKEISGDDASLSLAQVSMKRIPVEMKVPDEIMIGSERISMQVLLPDGNFSFRGCITIAPLQALPISGQSYVKPLRNQEGEGYKDDFLLTYLPDKYGPTISGSVISMEGNGRQKPDTRVHLTLMGEHSDYLVSQADAQGRFSLALPFGGGEQELFIQAKGSDGSTPEVRIDREFDQRQLTLPAPAFELSQKERQVATIMARNIQLQKIYQLKIPGVLEDTLSREIPFYGQASLSVDLDRFVLLPTLEEVFINLVPGVSFVKRRKGNALQIQSNNPALSMFEPLIMVDEVPVFDLEKFIELPTSKIRYIDVIDDVYVKGDMRYGGLINLQTREGNMAGIDLPGNAFFIDYQTPGSSLQAPQQMDSATGQVPDFRNTVKWMADVTISPDETLDLSFHAPAYPGDYVVLMQGMDQDGDAVIAEYSFKVLESK